MNNKGFTLIELVATLVILGLVASLGLYSMNFNMNKAKEKTEEVFVDTLRDAVDVYLSSEMGSLNIGNECDGKISKKHNPSTKVYEVTDVITFDDVINSSYKPLSMSDFVNPANKDVAGKYNCKIDAKIKVYRDEDYVYYYSINKSELGCLNNIGDTDGDGTLDYSSVISNLPEGYSCR